MEKETNIINKTYITVQIPEELAEYVMQQTTVCGRYVTTRAKGNTTHHLAKYFGFYLLLKAEAPGAGWIEDYTKQIPTLSRNFNISQRTFFSYLRQLEAMKLAFREGKKIRLVGWDQLADLFDINTRKRTQINFDYAGKQKIHWWFAAIEIQNNKGNSAYMVNRKMNRNSEEINFLQTALNRRGFDSSKAKQPEYVFERLRMLYDEDFISGTEVHEIIIRMRADFNRSCKKIAKAWCMSPQSVAYWKTQMSKQKIIDVTKLDPLVSKWARDNKDVGKNKFCHVLYDEKIKQRILIKCHQITIIKRWEAQDFIKKNDAA